MEGKPLFLTCLWYWWCFGSIFSQNLPGVRVGKHRSKTAMLKCSDCKLAISCNARITLPNKARLCSYGMLHRHMGLLRMPPKKPSRLPASGFCYISELFLIDGFLKDSVLETHPHVASGLSWVGIAQAINADWRTQTGGNGNVCTCLHAPHHPTRSLDKFMKRSGMKWRFPQLHWILLAIDFQATDFWWNHAELSITRTNSTTLKEYHLVSLRQMANIV